MGQIYNGTLIIQTNNYDSPTGDYILAPIANPAQSDNVKDGKQGYDGAGNVVVGTNEGGYAGLISSYEEMDSYLTEENVGRILQYLGQAEGSEGGTPAPVNPIAVGDEITKLYFDTTKTPDFSLLDWSNAEENESMSGSFILTLLRSQNFSDQRGIVSAVKIPAGTTMQGISFTKDNYMLGCLDGFAFIEGEELAPMFGSGWSYDTLNEDGTVSISSAGPATEINQQDIWGEYISKDGQWKSESKYKTNQTYIIEQKDGVLKALPLAE